MTEHQSRFNIDELFAAVEAAAAERNAMSGRITALETTNFRLHQESNELRAQLAEALTLAEKTKATAASATRSADQAEAKGARHLNRVRQLETDLATTNEDIVRVSAAVFSLCPPVSHRMAPEF